MRDRDLMQRALNVRLVMTVTAFCFAVVCFPTFGQAAISTSRSNIKHPSVTAIIKQKSDGSPITVGACQSGGGKVVKSGDEWVCAAGKK